MPKPRNKKPQKPRASRCDSHHGPRGNRRRPNNIAFPALRNGGYRNENSHRRGRRTSSFPSFGSQSSQIRHNRYKKQLDSIRVDGMAVNKHLKRMLDTADELSATFKCTMDWDPTVQVNYLFPNNSPCTPTSKAATTVATVSPPSAVRPETINGFHYHSVNPTASSPASSISPLTVVSNAHLPHAIQAAGPHVILQQQAQAAPATTPTPTHSNHRRPGLFTAHPDEGGYRCCYSAMSDVQPARHAVEAVVAYHRPASLGLPPVTTLTPPMMTAAVATATAALPLMGEEREYGGGGGAGSSASQQKTYTPMDFSMTMMEDREAGQEEQMGEQGEHGLPGAPVAFRGRLFGV